MSLPVILRSSAEADVAEIFGDLEFVRAGLGKRFLSRLREALGRIEWMPEMFGAVWEDVRAVKVQKFRYVVYQSSWRIALRCWQCCMAHGMSRNGGRAFSDTQIQVPHGRTGVIWPVAIILQRAGSVSDG